MPDINVERMDRQSSNSTLLQLTDTFFPSGTFTLSHGLEALYKTGQLENSQDLADLIRYQLRYKVCPTDLVVLGVCYQASAENDMERVYQVDSYLWAHTLIESARNTQRKSGRALLTVAKEIWPDPKLESMAIAAQKQTFHCLNSAVLGVVSQVSGLSPWNAVVLNR